MLCDAGGATVVRALPRHETSLNLTSKFLGCGIIQGEAATAKF